MNGRATGGGEGRDASASRPRPLYAFGVATTTLLCAVFFWPWALPRETVSGLVGRWLATGTRRQRAFAAFVAPWIDTYVHLPLGVESCAELYELEESARRAIYTSIDETYLAGERAFVEARNRENLHPVYVHDVYECGDCGRHGYPADRCPDCGCEWYWSIAEWNGN